MNPLQLSVNGETYDITVEPRRTLADALRKDCGLTGTHIGCEHGACGACTVIMDGAAIRSCLLFAVQAEGAQIRTVEGLGGESPLQLAFMAHHGLQCGYCTPGFLMLATALLEGDPDASEETIVDALSSNLCRCTGYAGIIAAVLAAKETLHPLPPGEGRGEGAATWTALTQPSPGGRGLEDPTQRSSRWR